MLVVDIEKSIGDFTLDVCFETEDTVLSLLGCSGSGKSMALKCIAGIEKPDRGRIVLNNRVLFDSEKGINLSPQKRKVGYLFQQYALFPDMSVMENIEVALHHLPKDERKAVAIEKLREFRIEHIKDKKPFEISGGEQQRVALARIIANDPEILLLDEPFSSLDSYLKWQLLADMKTMLENFKKDVVFVTHSIDEVIGLSDKICVLNNGKSEPVTYIEEAMKRPQTVSTAKLFGCKNYSKAELMGDAVLCSDWNIKLQIKSAEKTSDKALYIGVFSQDIELKPDDYDGETLIRCTVSQVVKTETTENVILRICDTDSLLCASVPTGETINIDDHIKAYIPTEKLLLLEE